MTTSIMALIHKHVGKLVKTSKPVILIELGLATGLCFARIFPFSVQILLVLLRRFHSGSETLIGVPLG